MQESDPNSTANLNQKAGGGEGETSLLNQKAGEGGETSLLNQKAGGGEGETSLLSQKAGEGGETSLLSQKAGGGGETSLLSQKAGEETAVSDTTAAVDLSHLQAADRQWHTGSILPPSETHRGDIFSDRHHGTSVSESGSHKTVSPRRRLFVAESDRGEEPEEKKRAGNSTKVCTRISCMALVCRSSSVRKSL